MRSDPLLEGVTTAQEAGRPDSGPTPRGLRLIIHIDGAARGNPGPAGIGVMLETDDRRLCRTFCRYIGEATNNVAEYEALLLALREARLLHPADVRIRSDSELLVRQLHGRYRVKHPRLRVLYAQALGLIHELAAASCRFSVEHISRELNRRADALANQAIDEAPTGRRPQKDPS